MSKKITFTENEISTLNDDIQRFMGITDISMKQQIVDLIEQTGQIRRFGYGSLINNPEIKTDSLEHAHIAGWKKGYVCMDNTYRGTSEKPGLTLGLDESDDPDAKIEGAVLVSTLEQENAFKDTRKWIQAYGNREYPSGMPIYSFKVLDVTAKNGSKSPAVVCVADDKGPLYVGNSLSPEEKAAIVATAVADPTKNPNTKPISEGGKGLDPEHGGYLTNLQYLQNDVNNNLKAAKAIDPDIQYILECALIYRATMQPKERQTLEKLETTGNLDPATYAVPTFIPDAYWDAPEFLEQSQKHLYQLNLS